MLERITGNWQTSLAGLGVLIVTAAEWSQGGSTLSLQDIVQLLIASGFLAGKDAKTGSAP